MTTRMLIDARHREETRVAVVTGNRIEELDFESAEHKQIKGNIYLAKVTRVEPSLQAAFIDYGGNRHGFLAFAEIHPDYYQIPREDRERLLAEEAEAAAEEAALREQEEDDEDEPSDIIGGSDDTDDDDTDVIEVESDDSVDTIDITEGEEPELDAGSVEGGDSDVSGDPLDDHDGGARNNRRRRGRGRGGREGQAAKASDEVRAKRMNLRRRYKIQDVIHRRQVLLVQVVKEERGNKGAALTTYLSLAGRYCVLMPNTSHGGGISRKIHSAADRKRLKSIMSDLTLPATMGCIIRTAGLARTKPEIKRDFDYLARLWDGIRENTLKGSAPMLIHSDSDLIKRAIRDIYNKDIEEVFVEGDEGYRAAREFMKLLMPSHAKKVQHYADPVPLFQRYHVEDQLNAMYQPVVQLKSGGYIVINPTEALVSIDINSGRSTKEHGIEQTALSTNLEAAREIARQLRLRDMAGLVVIDFIDMEHHGNARKVERAMKEALKHDRARIQVGRISGFGLMEMSRQRLRTGVLEASTRQCPHCEGTGLVRTASSSALSALRLIEEEAARGNGNQIVLQASQEATIYCLNNKRAELAAIEKLYHVRILIVPNGETEGAKLAVSSSGPRPEAPVMLPPVIDLDEEEEIEDAYDDIDDVEEAEARPPRREREARSAGEVRGDGEAAEGGEGRRRKRRRGRRGGKGREREGIAAEGSAEPVEVANDDRAAVADDVPVSDAGEARPRARRGRRGGRGDAAQMPVAEAVAEEIPAEAAPEEKPKRRSRAKPKAEAPAVETAPDAEPDAEPVKAKAKPRGKAKAEAVAEAATEPLAETATVPAKPKASRKKAAAKDVADSDSATSSEGEASEGAPRSGWWQRTFG
jgi:ribonuclease E